MTGEFPDVNSLAQIISQISTAHWSHADFTAKVELLESLKDNLINQSSRGDDGYLLSDWLDTALVFINECENVFNCPRNADFVNFLTPSIANQLEYIRDQLQVTHFLLPRALPVQII
ncbi:conserved Plasmodium protein, unknown function [Babesia microti strain RI]|uniref:Uncharacterized protein n=1 Tax=Babesia microti (strain RI) TaxID=1133968 RepID=A0A1R4A9U3_BABMR|nr:conserved Plasmodium protein, unknown function [Babesia microti strain RI]SJK85768.1 conserved Plasmodium protein, unknown function [Babesia microti strain RI]|eukprot:XP_021337991.1 conserved Plasmodium protein, unknown function [Babesia microti strain RI]